MLNIIRSKCNFCSLEVNGKSFVVFVDVRVQMSESSKKNHVAWIPGENLKHIIDYKWHIIKTFAPRLHNFEESLKTNN